MQDHTFTLIVSSVVACPMLCTSEIVSVAQRLV